MSLVGKKPIAIPKDVKVEVKDDVVLVEGPKGKISRALAGRISVEVKDNQVIVKRGGEAKLDKSMHGLFRALIANMIKGVNEGYVKELEIIGTGYKAQVQGNSLSLNLGFSHPVVFTIPEGIKIEAPKQTQLVIRGIDKEKIGEIASEIRAIRPPEPYKGKGVRYAGERVKKKIGKAQATSK